MKLYEIDRSGNCYKVRLMLSLLGQAYEKRPVDLPKREQFEPWFLAINPLHTVPVLDDGGLIIRDSQAILVYLAAKYGKGAWYPADPASLADMQQWLAYANNEVLHHLAYTRAIVFGLRPGDLAKGQAAAKDVLAHIDRSLAGKEWLACGRPTVADVAIYPYVAMIPQADVPLTPHAHLSAWTKRVEALPGYTGLPKPPAKPV